MTRKVQINLGGGITLKQELPDLTLRKKIERCLEIFIILFVVFLPLMLFLIIPNEIMSLLVPLVIFTLYPILNSDDNGEAIAISVVWGVCSLLIVGLCMVVCLMIYPEVKNPKYESREFSIYKENIISLGGRSESISGSMNGNFTLGIGTVSGSVDTSVVLRAARIAEGGGTQLFLIQNSPILHEDLSLGTEPYYETFSKQTREIRPGLPKIVQAITKEKPVGPWEDTGILVDRVHIPSNTIRVGFKL